MVHPHVEFWRARASSPFRILLPAWIGMWIILGLATTPWRSVHFYRSPWAILPAIALFAIGIWIYRRSGVHFSLNQLSGMPEVRQNTKSQILVTSGVHGHVRHPIYLAHVCEMLAWSLGTGLAVCYALTSFAIATGAIMIRLEDKELERRFGQSYREYRMRVPAVLPRISGRANSL